MESNTIERSKMNGYELELCFKFNGEDLINRKLSCSIKGKPKNDQDFQNLLEILASLDTACQKITMADRISGLIKPE